MKKYFFISSFIITILLLGCDGVLRGRGFVINNETIKSGVVSDSLFTLLLLNNGVENVLLQIDPNVDSLVNSKNIEEYGFRIFTDSLGYFEFEEIVAPGKWVAGIVATKQGYLSDTLYFNYSGVGTQNNLIFSLKKQ